jgi:hypothetical protein
MAHDSHYVVTENIARFEALLGNGGLEADQVPVVERLLSQARLELAALTGGSRPAQGPAAKSVAC